jgi:hypothetical protein
MILLALAACGAASPPLPPDAVILPEPVADQLLHQCSRALPPAYDGHWRPDAGDIAALEAALPGRLRPGDDEVRGAPRGWHRQYAGFLRGGHRYVYGNFFPGQMGGAGGDADGWRRTPIMVCDGGHAFFGVEYDVDARRITEIDFNGYA